MSDLNSTCAPSEHIAGDVKDIREYNGYAYPESLGGERADVYIYYHVKLCQICGEVLARIPFHTEYEIKPFGSGTASSGI